MSSTRAEPALSGARLVAVAVVLSAAAASAALLPGGDAMSTAALMSAQATAAATITATPACASGTAAYATALTAAVAAPAPTLWWRFDTAAGAKTVKDFAPTNVNKGSVRKAAGTSGITFGTPGTGVIHCDTTFGMVTSGAATNTGFVVLPASRVSPTRFTLSLWVKLPAGASGRLLGFGSSKTGPSPTQDRALAIDATGHVTFTLNKGVPGTTLVLTSPTAITDGKAHFLVATLDPGQATLYVDGSAVATSATGAPTGPLAATYNGYWRAGYDQPQQCAGDLDEVALWEGTALSAAQVTTLAGSDHWW